MMKFEVMVNLPVGTALGGGGTDVVVEDEALGFGPFSGLVVLLDDIRAVPYFACYNII